MAKLQKYGLLWDAGYDALQIEQHFIRKGGQFKDAKGRIYGNGLYYHYREMQRIIWPTDDNHRWSDLSLRSLAENEITVLVGSSDSAKTYSVSKFALCDYWCFPDNTLWLLSSTEGRGAELRMWGTIKNLFNRAKERFDYLPGYFLESIKALTTQEIDEEKEFARSLTTGMMFVPCKRGSAEVGMSAFVGVKSPRLRHYGDEVQFMYPSFLSAYSNWYGKSNFKGALSGNPADIGDPLCTAAEPKDGGWDNFVDTGKTQEWTSKFYNAHVIALDGRDSPNFDYPQDQPQKYPYLIGKKKLDAVRETLGEDSWEWWQQCVGKPSKNMALYRVITAELCKQHGAHDNAQWLSTQRTLIYALDPAYGGGDRCVGRPLEFGMGLERQQILKVHPPELIPISLNSKLEPEQQIAKYVKARLEALEIPPENCFYDSFGKGTMGYYFAEEFKGQQPIPIDSGSQPSDRPVRLDMFVDDGNGKQRLMRCDERYSKFVTEMWYSVREAIVCNQLKELDRETMKEGAARIYRIVKGNKIEVEPKDEMKERLRYSPDLMDDLAIGLEGARRRGFEISKMGKLKEDVDNSWLDEAEEEHDAIISKGLLQHQNYGGLLRHAA